jgi:antitoxin ParD1/3/4
MNISLPKALEKYIRDKVKSGQYASASEVVREGLRVLRDQERQVEEIREKVREGQQAIAEGRYLTEEQFKSRMGKRLRELAKQKKASVE